MNLELRQEPRNVQGKIAGCGLVVGVTQGTHTREQLEAQPHTQLIASVRELPALLERVGH
jgi:phosphoglycolate phosphatase-like HAD superfamily hydrolase